MGSSARLTAKPAQTYELQFPQITDTEESDEDNGVEYDFRWQDEDLYWHVPPATSLVRK